MGWTDEQTPIDISGTKFPKINAGTGSPPERFWYIKNEFVRHSERLLQEGRMFSCIRARLESNRWVCDGNGTSIEEMASFVWSLRLFYMKSECMSIYSICNYLEKYIDDEQVKMFYRRMRDSWEDYLSWDVEVLPKQYKGPIKTKKHLIDTLLYSGNFHSQEKYKKRYDELLNILDEKLIFMHTYNVLHSSYQMNQIGRSLRDLKEDNMVILLPNHLRHEWDINCPYEVTRSTR